VSHHPVHTNILKLLQLRQELTELVKPNTKAAHPRIDFDVNVSDFATFACCAIEFFNHVETINGRSKFVLKTRISLTLPESSQTKDRFRDARLTQLDSLFRQRYAKPMRAFSVQPVRARNRTVTIRIGLYNSHHLYAWPDPVVNNVEIRSECV
jgi:hypothetical protein